MKNIFSLLCIAALLASCGSKKDTNKVSRDFRITVVSIDKDLVKLNCTEGCAWVDLSFNLKKYEPQGVDAYGMTTPLNTLADLSDKLPDFKFTIERTDNGAELRSVRNTGWNKLSISCVGPCNQTVDYQGMVR